MAFVSGVPVLGLASFSGKAVVPRAQKGVVVAASRRATVVSMAKEGYPSSDVLGLGKDIPSALYILLSIGAFGIGVAAVTKSNLLQPLTAETVNPQFVAGSLMLPISWGLHVAAFIQKVNSK